MRYDLKMLNILSGCGLVPKKLKSNDLGEIICLIEIKMSGL